MSEEDNSKIHSSLPPNYVSILQLQEQWLKKKQKQKEEDEEEAKQKQIEIEKEQKKQELAAQKQIRDTQQHQKQGNCVESNGIVEKSNLGRFRGCDHVEKSSLGRFRGCGNVEKSSLGRSRGFDNVEKFSLGRFRGSDNVEKSSFGGFQGCGNVKKSSLGGFQGFDHVEKSSLGGLQGSDHVEKSSLGRFQGSGHVEKSSLGRSRGFDNGEKSSLGRFQGSDHVEKSSLGRFRGSDSVEKSSLGGFQGCGNVEKCSLGGFQGSDHVEKSSLERSRGFDNGEKSNLGRFQGPDRSGYTQHRDYNRNYDKGVYKDKGKGKIGEVEERGADSERGDFERCDGKVRQYGGGGGGFGEVMSLRVVAVEEDGNVGVKKLDDGFRGGLTSNVGDLCVNSDVSKNLLEGGTMVETKDCLERGEKVDDGAMRVGNKKNGPFRPSGVKKGGSLMNVVDYDNVGRVECMQNREEVLQGKDDLKISDMGVAIEVGNVGHRNIWSKKKNQNKNGLSMSEFGRGTQQAQKKGRNVQEENKILFDSKKENAGKNGEGGKDNIGDAEDAADMGVAIELRNVEQKSRGGHQKNRNKKGLSRSEFGRGTEQGRGNWRYVRVENVIQLDLEKESGEVIVKRDGDNMGDVKDVADMGVVIERMNVEEKRKGKLKKNLNKKGLSKSEFGRGVEQGQGNGRNMEEGNIIQSDLKKENGGKIAEGSGDNTGDGEDIIDMGVAVEVMNVEQRSKGGYKKKGNKTSLSRSEFGKGTGQGQENGRGMGEQVVIQLDLRKVNDEKNGEERTGDNMGDGDREAETRAQLRESKHNRVGVGKRNVNERVMDRTRLNNEKYAVKGASARAEIIKVTVGEECRTDESVNENPVVIMSEINEKTNLCSDGSQRNVSDSTVNVEFQDNTIKSSESLKPELFGEHDDNSPLMKNEANGKSSMFRYKSKGNRDGEGFSRPKSRRDFDEHSLDIQRVGNRRKNDQKYGHNRRLQKDRWPADKQKDSGFMWVKKGCNAGADVSET